MISRIPLIFKEELSEERKHYLDDKAVDYDTEDSFNVDDVVGCDRIKSDLSNNIFKPMLCSTLTDFTYAVFWSILIYGQHGSGKLTITKYIAHQLRWKMVTFDDLDMIQMDPSAASNTLNEAYDYWLSKDETIILIKNYDEVLNIEPSNLKYYIVKKTIINTISSIVYKLNDLHKNKVMLICHVNSGKMDKFINNTQNQLDAFAYTFKQTNPTLDDISMYIAIRIFDQNNDIKWKQLLNFAYMIDGVNWNRLKRLVNNTFKLPTRDLCHESLFYYDWKAKIRLLNIYDFKNTFNEDARLSGQLGISKSRFNSKNFYK